MTASHVQNGRGAVRPYVYGPAGHADFIAAVFGGVVSERNPRGPARVDIGDSSLWVEEGPLPDGYEPWTGSVYVYVPDVDAAFARAQARGVTVIAPPTDKPYRERQAGFTDAAGNSWWVSTYTG